MTRELDTASESNLEFMVEEIKKKLKMAAVSAIKSGHFDLRQYDDLRDIYELVASKSAFSISEMESLVTELGRLRKSK